MGIRAVRTAGTVFAVLVCAALCCVARAAGGDEKFVSHDADVEGVKIHYTTGGHGPTVIFMRWRSRSALRKRA